MTDKAKTDELIKTLEGVLEGVLEDFKQPKIPEGFTAWNGGECPVDGDWLVEVRFRGVSVGAKECADDLFWAHDGSSSDIIAYRIISEPVQLTPAEKAVVERLKVLRNDGFQAPDLAIALGVRSDSFEIFNKFFGEK